MDNGLLRKMSMMLSKLSKKDLEKNIQTAKNILANSNKEDLNKFINSKEVESFLGKDKDEIAKALNNNELDINKLNTDALNNSLNDNL